jgi:3-hydroxyisobutyrate dehydrogenase
MMLKDLRLALASANEAGAPAELGEHARAIYEQLSSDGHDGLDFSGVMKRVKGEI